MVPPGVYVTPAARPFTRMALVSAVQVPPRTRGASLVEKSFPLFGEVMTGAAAALLSMVKVWPLL